MIVSWSASTVELICGSSSFSRRCLSAYNALHSQEIFIGCIGYVHMLSGSIAEMNKFEHGLGFIQTWVSNRSGCWFIILRKFFSGNCRVRLACLRLGLDRASHTMGRVHKVNKVKHDYFEWRRPNSQFKSKFCRKIHVHVIRLFDTDTETF